MPLKYGASFYVSHINRLNQNEWPGLATPGGRRHVRLTGSLLCMSSPSTVASPSLMPTRTLAPFFGVREELGGYSAAVEHFNKVNQTIADLLDRLRKPSPDRRQPLVAEWKIQRDVVRRLASKDLGYARAQYVSVRDRVSPARADYLDDKTAWREKRMQRLSRRAPSRLYRATNVVPSNTLGDRYDESHAATEQ